ncbi:MAG: di-trans,poly-cis-decaprenylcistransferase [Candidatus Moranbacteria bacterium]|nr:di-trans,poly-cis-decaprenylcistransferase [Candidatus Moranbacteria bacterium]
MENKEIKIIPRHLAIIPDGNRRWSRQRDKDPWEGHREGAKTTEILIKRANEMGIECLSFWGSSQDNLKKRPLEEKKALLEIYLEYFYRILESDEVHKNEARVNIIGEWEEQFPAKLKNVLKDCIQNTKHYSKRMLNFFLAYNGDREMLQAIQKIISQGIHSENITPEIIKQNLFTRELPAVDYLVRTGGEPHLSTGFMMWDVANAQLYFSQKLYPDFKVKEFEEAIEDFSQRKRRLGA